MSDIKGCIFDLDGVIVDTAKYHYLAWKKLAQELNFEFTESDNERLKGVSRMDSLNILLQIGGLSFDDETKVKLAEKKNTWYKEYISHMTPDEILPGVKEFIRAVKNCGMKTAIGSVSKNTMSILKSINMIGYFDSIIDGNKISHAKPDPEVFLKAAQELNIEPGNCVVFEDAKAGIEAAINAGMYSIGIGKKEILGRADIVISSFNEMTTEKLNF